MEPCLVNITNRLPPDGPQKPTQRISRIKYHDFVLVNGSEDGNLIREVIEEHMVFVLPKLWWMANMVVAGGSEIGECRIFICTHSS